MVRRDACTGHLQLHQLLQVSLGASPAQVGALVQHARARAGGVQQHPVKGALAVGGVLPCELLQGGAPHGDQLVEALQARSPVQQLQARGVPVQRQQAALKGEVHVRRCWAA